MARETSAFSSYDDFDKWTRESCKGIGIPEDFLETLVDDDDWSFLIKASALLEAALTRSLVQKLGEEALQDVITKMQYARKVEWAVALGLLEKEHQTFTDKLAWLRNQVVHDIRNVNFDLKAFVADLDTSQQQSLFSSCVLCFASVEDQNEFTALTTHSNPKVYIWAALIVTILDLYRDKIVQLERGHLGPT